MAITYIHYADGKPFYVGFGKRRDRASNFEARTKLWKEFASGKDVTCRVVFEGSEEDAYELEAFIIETIGLENLTNVEPGGGPRGYRPYGPSRAAKYVYVKDDTGEVFEALKWALEASNGKHKLRSFRAQLDGQNPNRTGFTRVRKEEVDLSQ